MYWAKFAKLKTKAGSCFKITQKQISVRMMCGLCAPCQKVLYKTQVSRGSLYVYVSVFAAGLE